MISPNVTTCAECSDIQTLIDDIDCCIAKAGASMYANLVYMLNKRVPASALIDLLNYKRILQRKNVNSDYLSTFTVDMIAGRIAVLKYKQ